VGVTLGQLIVWTGIRRHPTAEGVERRRPRGAAAARRGRAASARPALHGARAPGPQAADDGAGQRGVTLSHILPRLAGVVTDRGGSTSHFASLARERGIPMVLGVADATRRIPDGAQVAVDGVAGIVRWMR